jgi:class 3 adenylate cyclase/tetratricopeptide (TPR) repeat protein
MHSRLLALRASLINPRTTGYSQPVSQTNGFSPALPVETSIRGWLDCMGLGRYAEAFEENAIGWDVLLHLDHDVLKEIGIRAAGDRVRVLHAIKSLRAQVAGATGSGGAERRQLTVLFCDLVGSTQLAHRMDPEDLSELITIYQAACRSAIERYRGFIARYVGDGILAYFGYPHAHEDDAERAVRAGLGILAGMRTVNAQIAERQAVELSVRIGIATGPVVVGDLIGEGASREMPALGETPNVAARLQGLAEPDTVVIAAETRRLALDYFEYRDLQDQAIKGLPNPVRAWQVLGERATEVRFDARRTSGTTPLVGRQEELALILRRWEQVKEGDGQVVLLSGEAGIGKSRLAQVLRESIAGEPHTLVCYQCSPYHTSSALHPIIEQIRRAAAIDEADDAGSKLDKLEAWLAGTFGDVSAVAPLFAALLSIDAGERYPVSHLRPEALKDATLKALIGQLSALSTRQPVLLIVEDAQWIDPTTQELLDALLPGIADQRVLAAVTYRPDYRPVWSGLAHALTLPVVRLPRGDIARMTEQVVGGKSLPREVLEQIVEKTDGIPLFVEELTKTILESGLVIEADDSYRISGSLSDLAVPTTLQDSLMARLDRAASVREVAQVGACLGRQFSRDLLAAVLALDETTLKAALQQLEATGLLLRTDTTKSVGYAFKHALVQDVAYNSLLKSRRKHFHARIAEFLSKSVDGALAPEVLAHHYMEAGKFEQAASSWCKAAKRAGARYAHPEAIAHCRKGLAALSHLPRSGERTGTELSLRIALAEGLRITDRHSEALAELGTAEAVASEDEHQLELSHIHHLRGNIYYPLGRIESCFAEHQAAWRLAKRAGSTEYEARALGGLGDAHFLAGRIQQAHKHFEDCVALARANRLVLTEVAYLPMRAVTHMYCLRFNESLDDCRAVIGLVPRVGQARGALISRSTSSWILLDQCQFLAAEQHARKGLEAVETIGARRFIPLFNDVLARIRLCAGDHAGALELLDESWKVSREAGVAFAGPVVLGTVALATTDPERRAEALRQGEAILRDGCASHNHFRFYRDAIEVSLREQRWDTAERYASALERYFGAKASPWSDFFIARGRALAAAGRWGGDVTVVTQLRRLRAYASDNGILAAVPALDEALTGTDANLPEHLGSGGYVMTEQLEIRSIPMVGA